MDPLDLKPVVHRTLSDEAAALLRDAIRRGALAPGSRLNERDLASRMGMSRIPVREAIRLLVEEGLVTKEPHRGAFVYAPSQVEIEEISSLRVVLERFVVERAVPRFRPEHEAQLQRIVHGMRGTALDEDYKRLYELDREFHSLLWRIADHSLLLEVVSGLRSRLDRFLYEAAIATSDFKFDIYIASHARLLRVLKSGDIAAAQAAITDHILSSKERILAYMLALSGTVGPDDQALQPELTLILEDGKR